MATETIDLILVCFLKPHHDKKRDDGGTQPNSNADNGNLMNGSGEPLFLFEANSFRYEIREVQKWIYI
jgi:hypothetical protein